jgi:hypothetical protein
MQPNESMLFKVLHGFFVFLRRSFRFERAQVSSLAGPCEAASGTKVNQPTSNSRPNEN